MSSVSDQYRRALQEAQRSLKEGDKSSTRYWAQQAANLAPNEEDPWLILAAVASPRASLAYLNQALEINPGSQRARKGMHWAIDRYRASEAVIEPPPSIKPLIAAPIPPEALVRQRPAVLPIIIGLAVLIIGLFIWFGFPAISSSLNSGQPMAMAQNLEKATRTPLPMDTATPSATPTDIPTNTSLPTATEIPTLTPSPTEIATEEQPPTSTDTPLPVPTGTEVPPEPPEPTLGPDGKRNTPQVSSDTRWMDVDLSQQRVYAFEGDQIVEMFLVSTGLPQTPTVTGQYRIYVKYRAADMTGPGYHLTDVPYVMYFNHSYGLHGTYWHHNFGVPMSHGCVNLRTKDAKWLFEWASVGTIVNVHR